MLRSDRSQVFILKYWPLIFSLGVPFVFLKIQFQWEHLFVLVPIFLGAVFRASLAVIEIPDGTIRYQRSFNWRELPYDEIVCCDVSRLSVGIGYISLKRFLWPWGKLYFILDALRANISETSLVPLINEQKGEKAELRDEREFSWCCSFPWGFGCRGTKRRLASWRAAAEWSGSQSGRRSGAGFAAGSRALGTRNATTSDFYSGTHCN
jgi:hypothetical protein